MLLGYVCGYGVMTDKKSKIVVEDGQERDLADSRESMDRDKEIRKLAKHIS